MLEWAKNQNPNVLALAGIIAALLGTVLAVLYQEFRDWREDLNKAYSICVVNPAIDPSFSGYPEKYCENFGYSREDATRFIEDVGDDFIENGPNQTDCSSRLVSISRWRDSQISQGISKELIETKELEFLCQVPKECLPNFEAIEKDCRNISL